LFQDVRAMELRCWFESLTIEEVDPLFLKEFHSNPAQVIEEGNKVYSIQGREWRGFVVGGVVSFKEDGGELFAPSGLTADQDTR